MYVICSDLEGVWVPEVWINVAEKTGIEELRLTTRDITDYNVLMQKRLEVLHQNNLSLSDIQEVIATIKPMEGALDTIKWIQSITRFIVVSDTFVEFADPLMKQLDYPTLFCHALTVDKNNMVTDYNLRQPDPKRQVVKAMQNLNYKVIAFGDSYNDVTMLDQAEKGILFKPPQNVIDDYPQYPVVNNYDDLKALLIKYLKE